MTSAARLALVRSLAFVLIVVAVGCGDGGGDASPSRTPTPAATPTVRPGTLDASFGSGGVAIADFDGRNDTARAIAVQPDGRVVVAGGSLLPDGESAFALVRHLPDGTPDASFGEGGRVLTPPGGHAFTEATAVAVAGDGHIVLAGQRLDEGPNDQRTWQLVRYTANGVLEPTSGVDLNVILTEGGAGEPKGVAVQPDGAVVVAGTWFDGRSEFAVVRVLANGVSDPTFGFQGVRTFAVARATELHRLVLQSDGKILAGGIALGDANDVGFVLVRLLQNGAFDSHFGDAGSVVTRIASGVAGALLGMTAGADGSITVAGFTSGPPEHGSGFSGPLVIARYGADGQLDAAFGDGGLVRTAVDVGDGSVALIEPDGGVLVGDGTAAGEAFSRARVRRIDPRGVLDERFGDAGTFAQHLRPDDDSAFTALALQPDGRLVAAGYSRLSLDAYDFALARIWR